MRFIDVTGKLKSARRYAAGITRRDVDVSSADKMADVIQQLSGRVEALEGRLGPDSSEFEIDVGRAGSQVLLNHGYGCPVRWYVTRWTPLGPAEDKLNGSLWVARELYGPALTSLVSGAINATCGSRFQVIEKSLIYGVRFLWRTPGTTRTVKASIWLDSSGARLASASVSCPGNGIYVAEFASPLEVSGSLLNVDLSVGIWDGANYTHTTASDALRSNLNWYYPNSYLKSISLTSAGDARPITNSGGEDYWVEPCFVQSTTPRLSDDVDNTTDKVLALKSYSQGRAVIRVEPSQQEITRK